MSGLEDRFFLRLVELAGRLGIIPGRIASFATGPKAAVQKDLSLNRLCRPDAWENPEWLMINQALALRPEIVHRKAFEWTQCIFGLERLGVLGSEVRVLGVGAGHEPVLYYLANRTALTVATDLYSGNFIETPESEAAPDFLTNPEKYAPFPYRKEALVALPADGCRLPFASGSFDIVYSLGSIEHFGGHEAATTAMREMARVVRLGGVVCIATEVIIEGGSHHEFFTPADVDFYLIGGSGLVPVESLDLRPPPRELIDDPVRIVETINRNPHIVMGEGRLRWTSAVLFLGKPHWYEVRSWLVSHFLSWLVSRLLFRLAALRARRDAQESSN